MNARAIQQLFTAAAISMGTIAMTTAVASASPLSSERITICHATASTTNPYVMITVDIQSIVGTSGHGRSGVNVGDIIPAFTYNGNETYPGNGDQAVLANGCNRVSPPPADYF